MKTSAILNPTMVAPNPPSGTARPDASDTDQPFRQVLSREVAERRDADKPDQKQNTAAKASEDTPGGTAKAQAPTANDSNDAETTEATPAAGEDAAARMLALVAQFAQFTTAAPETTSAAFARPDSGKQPLIAMTEPGILSSSESGKTASAIDMTALQADTNAATVQPADFDQQLDVAAGKMVASNLQPQATALQEIQDTQPVLPAAATAVAQHGASQIQAVAGSPADKLMPRVGANGWDQALGQKMVWMVAGTQQSASLTLNPPDLGPLQVVLNVSNAQATANFIAAQPEVRQAIEAAMPRLREMLGDAGIQLGQSSVSAGTPQQHGAFGEQRQGSGSSGHSEENGVMPIRTGQGVATVQQGLVDTFA